MIGQYYSDYKQRAEHVRYQHPVPLPTKSACECLFIEITDWTTSPGDGCSLLSGRYANIIMLHDNDQQLCVQQQTCVWLKAKLLHHRENTEMKHIRPSNNTDLVCLLTYLGKMFCCEICFFSIFQHVCKMIMYTCDVLMCRPTGPVSSSGAQWLRTTITG